MSYSCSRVDFRVLRKFDTAAMRVSTIDLILSRVRRCANVMVTTLYASAHLRLARTICSRALIARGFSLAHLRSLFVG